MTCNLVDVWLWRDQPPPLPQSPGGGSRRHPLPASTTRSCTFTHRPQAKLVEMIAQSNHQFVIETHSDHVIDWFSNPGYRRKVGSFGRSLSCISSGSPKTSPQTQLYQLSFDKCGNLSGQPQKLPAVLLGRDDEAIGITTMILCDMCVKTVIGRQRVWPFFAIRPPKTAGHQLRRWIKIGHGVIIYSNYGQYARRVEAEREGMETGGRLLPVWPGQNVLRRNRFKRKKTAFAASASKIRSNDRHVLALAAAGQATVLFTCDRDLKKDFL